MWLMECLNSWDMSSNSYKMKNHEILIDENREYSSEDLNAIFGINLLKKNYFIRPTQPQDGVVHKFNEIEYS